MKTVVASFNKVFKEANQTKKRYRILLGSAGSGKSVNVAQDYIIKLSDIRYQGANLLVIRETETSHLNSTFAELYNAINRLSLRDAWVVTKAPMMMVNRITHSQIIFKGFNDNDAREKIKSITFPTGKLVWIWCEEATDLRFEDLQLLDDRLRGNLPDNLYYQITMTFNPVNSQHWIKTYYWDRDSEDIFKLKTTYLDNRFIDQGYHTRMELRKLIDPEGYEIYGLGNWGDISGMILQNYTIQDVPQEFEFYDSIAIGQDFGFNHANAILQLGFKDGNIYVMKEIYVNEKDTNEIIEIAEKENISKRHIMWCDSAEPDRIKMWQKANYRASAVRKEPNSVVAQIDYLKQHRIFISPSCINTIKEIQQWRWQKDNKTGKYLDSPVEINDDAMAALRYGIESQRKDSKLRTMSKIGLGL